MARLAFFAITAASAIAFASCSSTSGGGNAGRAGSAIPAFGAETVGDAAAIVTHQPTDSQNAAAAIAALDALGSRIGSLASDEIASDPINPASSARAVPDGSCEDSFEFFVRQPRGDAAAQASPSTETREFFDPGCTQLARDAVRIVRSIGPTEEIVNRTIRLYAPAHSAPIATRFESSRISDARFGRWGFPLAGDGFSRTTSSALWISHRKQAVSSSKIVVLPSRTSASVYCEGSAGYSATGIPSLDATFGWEGGTLESPGSPSSVRTDDGEGIVTTSSTQRGNIFIGPIGSLWLNAGRPASGCPAAARTQTVAGGTPAGVFAIPIHATFRRGTLSGLFVPGAAFGGGYALSAYTVGRAGEDLGSVTIDGIVNDGRVEIATFEANPFGTGALTLTSTGAQYRLIDWTIVR
jgi:hypothetical protein